jgi:NO-binding membrane sensor protein with MHYT domain
MYRAIACLTEEHTGWVVVLATCVCWITCAVALMLEQRVQSRIDGRRLVWLLAAGFSIGAGIWSTHFIGMLGYDPGVVLGYEPRATGRPLPITDYAEILGTPAKPVPDPLRQAC